MAINAENLGDYTHSEAKAPAPETEVTNEQPTEENVNVDQETNVPEVDESNPWDITKHQDENGMVAGKYKNIDGMIKSLEHAEAKLTELQAEKQSGAAKGKNAEAALAKATEIANIERSAVEKYMESRTMTPELAAEVEAAGGNPTKVELDGMKAAAHYDKITGLVGGADNFNQMIEVMSEGKTEAQKANWLRAVNDPDMSEYAIKGLHAEYMERTGQRAVNNPRISGKSSNVGSVKPYGSQTEMLADANKARHNKAFRSEYEARKNVTPDAVFFNRG